MLKAPNSSKQLNQYSFLSDNTYDYLRDLESFLSKLVFQITLTENEKSNELIQKALQSFEQQLTNTKTNQEIEKIKSKLFDNDPVLHFFELHDEIIGITLSKQQRKELQAAFYSLYFRFLILREPIESIESQIKKRNEFLNRLTDEYSTFLDANELADDPYELTYLYRFETVLFLLKNEKKINRHELKLPLMIASMIDGSPDGKRYIIGGRSAKDSERRQKLITYILDLKNKHSKISVNEMKKGATLLATLKSDHQNPTDSSNVDVLDKPSLLSAESTGISSGDHTILKQHKAEESMMVVEHIEPFNQADVKDNRNDEIKQKSIMNPSSFTPDIFLLEDDYTYLENTDLFVIKTKFLLKDQGQDVRDILGKQIKEFITELNEGKAGIDNIQRKWSEPTLDLIRTNTSQKKQLSFNERNEIYAAFVSAFLRFNFLASQRNFKENDTLTQHTNQERERFFNKVQKEYTAIWDSCDLSSYELTYLYRFERAISSLKNILSANRNKGLFLTIGTLLEGSPAATKYITGGYSSVETERRVSLIECLCQTQKRIKRRNLNYKSAAIEFIEEQSEPSLLEKRKATEESKDQPPSVRVAISNDSFSLDSAPNLPSVIDLCKVVDEPTLQLTNPRVSNQKNSYSNHCSYTTSILSDEKQNERYIQIWTNGLLKDYWAVCEFYQAKNDGSANNHAIEELHQKISQHEDIDLLTNDDICSSPTHYQKFCEQYIKKCKEERSKLREKHSGYTFFYQTGQLTKKIQQIEDIICKLNPVLHEPTIDNPAEFSQNSFKEDDEFNTILKEDDEFNTILKEDDEFNTILNELIADENGITPYSYATPLLNNSVFNKKPAHQASSSPQHKSQRKNPYDDGLIDLINEVIADDGESNAYS